MARERGFDPQHLDVAAFAAAGGVLSGETSLQALPRLRELVEPEAGGGSPSVVAWRAHGAATLLGPAGRQPSLRLRADASVALVCQRCLQPVTVELHVDRRLVFVEGDDAAASLDAESDDDVLALAASFSLPTLLEDELLLAMPIVARHDACPQPLPNSAAVLAPATPLDNPAAHPFAALAALKRGALPN
ncbi:MAG: DUF177 domain-containing protein [Pseudomonadota bacterium]|nr:DUF177 domain-containing protein [Pseudomonadota bacterium]